LKNPAFLPVAIRFSSFEYHYEKGRKDRQSLKILFDFYLKNNIIYIKLLKDSKADKKNSLKNRNDFFGPAPNIKQRGTYG
jgi:hypothetical protein